MTPEVVNDELLPLLNGYIEKLHELERVLLEKLSFYNDRFPELVSKNDVRPGVISRTLSCIIVSRFNAQNLLSYLKKEGWARHFQTEYMPLPWRKANYFGHIEDIASSLKFYLLHSVYSQIESAYRIIIRHKNLNSNNKPALEINILTGTYNIDEIRFYDSIRNTIHNNGFYYPKNSKYNSWIFQFDNRNYEFQLGNSLNIGLIEAVDITKDQIHKLFSTLDNTEILSMGIVEDIT